MTAVTGPTAPTSPDAGDVPRRFLRVREGRLVAGVATGLAEHLRVPLLAVRFAFVVLATIGGAGLLLYGALWIVSPLDTEEITQEPPGLAAATRAGKRASWRRLPIRTGDLGQLVALVVLGIGIALLVQQTPLGISPQVFWPLLLAAIGVGLIWRQADDVGDQRDWRQALTGGGRLGALRVAVGSAVVTLGVIAFLVGQGQLRATVDGLVGMAVILLGFGLILGPWLWRLWRDLEAERKERIVSQERADVAAHLHDSVLQTLALIQKQAEDPREVVRLARRQERDLRTWLYGAGQAAETSFKAALTQAAVEVEEAHGVPVEVVAVGDCDIDDPVRAVLAAAREAVVNAAKHSGAVQVDVFAEVEDGSVEVFIRDRGIGFDPGSVPDDRLGVRRSIMGRMQRYGGQAEIRSIPGDGTEVRLVMRRNS